MIITPVVVNKIIIKLFVKFSNKLLYSEENKVGMKTQERIHFKKDRNLDCVANTSFQQVKLQHNFIFDVYHTSHYTNYLEIKNLNKATQFTN